MRPLDQPGEERHQAPVPCVHRPGLAAGVGEARQVPFDVLAADVGYIVREVALIEVRLELEDGGDVRFECLRTDGPGAERYIPVFEGL